KAILLINEADIFLEFREVGGYVSLERNALVVGKGPLVPTYTQTQLVFLRQLEYFQAIIFITSNRDQMVDPAVKFRIHIMFHYPLLDKNARKLLWEQKLEPMLNRMPRPECELDLESGTRDLSEYEMNGREISNTANPAPTITKDELHLLAMANIWKDSQELKSL
ncbi:hypothetical protein QBC36DRAFT_198553, partial [Triangularia setosa]